MPGHPPQPDNSPLHITQRMFEGVDADSIQARNLIQIAHQTVNIPHPRAKPIGIPENIPFRGSAHFEGRQEAMETLHWELDQGDRVSIAAIAGMGGIGKTELAVQYARRHLHDYPGGVCWLQARGGTPLTQVVEYVQTTLGLDVPQERNTQPLTLEQQLQWCWTYWEPAGRVLFVLDDVADLPACQPILLAPPARFRVVLTTRHRRLDTGFFALNLDVLSPDAALRLMEGLVGQDRVRRDCATADTLCQWLGYLPLGLELVGRYMAQDQGLSFAEMSVRLQEAECPLEDESLEGNYPLMTARRGMRTALELSWQELDRDAQDVARLLSLFAPAAVRWKLVTQVMQEVQGEAYRIRSARRQLANLHIVRPAEGQADVVSLHPLVREFLQDKQRSPAEARVTEDELKRALTWMMVKIAQSIAQTPTQETIQALLPAMPHLAAVAERFLDFLADDALLWPFVGLGRFYYGQGLYTLAEPWYEVCLKTTQDRLGAEHPDVAASLNNLAVLYYTQGRYSEAEPLYRDALEMSKRLLGAEHPDVAQSLNNLAALYRAQGRYSEAEPLYQQALTINAAALGAEHPDVATSHNNLAMLYRTQGHYSKAERLYQRALTIRETVLGTEHPSVAQSLNNLAELYYTQERYSEAEPLYRDALEMSKRLLGAEHPSVAQSLNNLAALYRAQGHYSEAEPLYQRALTIYEAVLGRQHPDVATSLDNLAGLYRAQGRYSEAERLYQRALTIRETVLGAEHPDVAQSLNNLAVLYHAQGRYSEAERLYQRVLTIYEAVLSGQHPDVAKVMKNYTTLLRATERNEKAEKLAARAQTEWDRHV